MSDRAAKKCSGKKRHASERRAVEWAKRTQISVGEPMKAYPCEFCKGWHVGSVIVHDAAHHQKPRDARYAG